MTQLKTHSILYEHLGENSDTPRTPIAVWDEQVDLNEEVTRCLNWDDNRLVKIFRYSVHDAALPEWLEPEEWLKSNTGWHWLWEFVPASFPEEWQRGMFGWDARDLIVTTKLLQTKKFRSEFRKSLRDQLVGWLEAEPDDRQYRSPFSDKQWEALLRYTARWEVDRRTEGLYNAHRYQTDIGVPGHSR